MKNKVIALALCTALTASALPVNVFAEEGQKTFTAGATTGFFGAESLDVAYNWDGWIMSIYGISENLFRLDENYVPQPWLAESYENVDELTWKFNIREGVTFSDGNPVTAEAVKKCFERTYEQNERASSTLDIASMEAEGQVLTIKTSAPNPTILNDLCDPLMGIYDADAQVDPELGVPCTGPFVATSFTAMTEVSMVKNENYWGGEPKVDKVELKIIDDTEALNMALQNGEIDLIAQLPAAGTAVFADNEDIVMESKTSTRANFLAYNMKHAVVEDAAVRKAIGMCVDREAFADVVYNGYATPSYGVYPESLPYGSTEGMELTVTGYDSEGAAALLADAGYEDTDGDGILDKDGEPLSLHAITYSYNTECLQLADMIQAELAGIGVEMTLETYDVLDDPLANDEFDLAILSHAMAPTGSSQYFISMLFESDSSENMAHYSNEEVDALSDKLKATFDEEERNTIAKDVCQQVISDKVYDFIVHQQLICAYSDKVTGFEVNPSEYYLITNTIDIAE
ncbi:MAG: ABC transporter substrate-binding protein [Lachnospiraceae bacterium]|nr:ABC transporter substrate-binding protein [Lachnospiraceae bacterium]